MSEPGGDEYPGASLGLPASGRGSLAPWRARIAAIIADWAASMAAAAGMFGPAVVTGHDWRAWMTYAVFFAESAVLTVFTGGSFGQLLARVVVVRLDRRPLEWWRSLLRTVLKCLVIPALIVGADRRGLDDILLGTAVVTRR
ncbi:MAG TPA: RDD family protein [Propionibacteriaceae bacterium]|nr:RDD family protein [Propionibacteriaceae bacterium]